ncbi:MAG: hypothetical protein AB8G11_06175 [Saprospiraceae bacterium]
MRNLLLLLFILSSLMSCKQDSSEVQLPSEIIQKLELVKNSSMIIVPKAKIISNDDDIIVYKASKSGSEDDFYEGEVIITTDKDNNIRSVNYTTSNMMHGDASEGFISFSGNIMLTEYNYSRFGRSQNIYLNGQKIYEHEYDD